MRAFLLSNFIWLKKEAINIAANTNIRELRYFFASYTATRILTWPVARRCNISTFRVALMMDPTAHKGKNERRT
jgi:hypothetical protein